MEAMRKGLGGEAGTKLRKRDDGIYSLVVEDAGRVPVRRGSHGGSAR
jgi:hypothetical protein